MGPSRRASGLSLSAIGLALVSLSSAAVSRRAVGPPAVLPGSWQYLGCYVDVAGRTLQDASYADGAAMTDESCIAFCTSKGFQYAGTEYSSECYCGSALAAGAGVAPAAECTMACSGDATEVCGGPSRLSLFHSPDPVGPQPNPGVDGWEYIGCYSEGTTGRTLSTAIGSIPAANMTVASCTTACKAAGFILAGLEYAGECYCGNTIANGGSLTTGCTMLCNGNSSEFCGGPSRMNVYDYQGLYNPTAVPSTTTAGPTNPGGGVSSTALPTATGLPTGWSYQGCYIDGANGRILPKQIDDNQQNTNAVCAAACFNLGYTISGTEYGVQCFCGNATFNGAAKTVDADCSTTCPGNTAEKCGAGNRVSIYSTGPPPVFQAPAPIPKIGDWTYQGCAQDNINDKHVFFWQIFYNNIMTPQMCLDTCAKYKYMAAGLEYGQECYCGDPANIAQAGSTFRPETECDVPCAGNASAICGGGSRMTTYFWTGTPFYSWSFPTGAAAGEYQILVGDGKTVPLMTMESITGKVTFLSKWGEGPANETGAYELDPSLVGVAADPWRELHLTTDVFCSAGLILPDKVGRQLTVGGWAGNALFGVRLYWPDGSAGVWGTHDWHENPDEVFIQVPRWYPTAMIMSNGSILVIGGEVGSNAAAQPNLEILPATGTPPVYMDWLDRTNPNNLYPFTFVLPSGGIFVGYFNEARILDPVTFATTKTLPLMPGGPNDNGMGGRTYPLEGAAVLLPQSAPYTDPIGVLICGGSIDGPHNALDNCVSTQPEVANPEWVLERLPSFRVMACMAPLPDGTYLIVNGAVHGVAGFGLATDPNLNAVLYDPTKAVGSRMTIMANTTIARLYHSEAVTLLDGRVLISGSDPLEPGVNPEEYRVEVFVPPYLLSGKPRPSFTITNKDWTYGQANIPFTLGAAARNGAIKVSLLGAVSSTHGNSMGARTLFPAFSCTGTSCTVTAPPNSHIAPPGWYQLFVLDGGVPAVGTYVRIGGDPAGLGNWPNVGGFQVPGV
ncbi:glyoxal oxidase like protein [Thozetella sp. PMI_491]|nr:glyoxal oxidase like protein [Thozetella sp. PMI_491]